MIPAERQAAIEEYLRKEGFAQVEELSRLLNVSSITIRRDLDLLEKKGLLERSHGGGPIPQFHLQGSSFRRKGPFPDGRESPLSANIRPLLFSRGKPFLSTADPRPVMWRRPGGAQGHTHHNQ